MNSGGTISSLPACCYVSFCSKFLSPDILCFTHPSFVSTLSSPLLPRWRGYLETEALVPPLGSPCRRTLVLLRCQYSFFCLLLLFSFFPLKFQRLTFLQELHLIFFCSAHEYHYSTSDIERMLALP